MFAFFSFLSLFLRVRVIDIDFLMIYLALCVFFFRWLLFLFFMQAKRFSLMLLLEKTFGFEMSLKSSTVSQ